MSIESSTWMILSSFSKDLASHLQRLDAVFRKLETGWVKAQTLQM